MVSKPVLIGSSRACLIGAMASMASIRFAAGCSCEACVQEPSSGNVWPSLGPSCKGFIAAARVVDLLEAPAEDACLMGRRGA